MITLPKTAVNYKGEPEGIQWPKGRPISECGRVYLIRQRANVFAVVYGLQVTKGLSRDLAAVEFGQCVMHQAECEGLLENTPPKGDLSTCHEFNATVA